jgi:predicted nuclease of restriction endonuclease-like RecB superfamily
MLAAPLLRVRTKSGSIIPLFCTRDEEVELARRLIQEFETSWKNREKKAELDDRISEVESECSRDFKLVRGLCALLERRCTFGNAITSSSSTSTSSIKSGISATATSIALGDPAIVRKALFEESSRRGFVLTDLERKEVVDSVASRLHLSSDDIASIMWSDLDDNLVLEKFDAMDAKSLIRWYNLALVQTLLFNCTKLEFSVSGGLNWKRILRRVKRLGLMYYLQEQQDAGDNKSSSRRRRIVCSIEGPLSLFRLTDRYGTALAKLLPSIILLSSGAEWHIDAWIMRRTMEGQRTLYNFKLSDSEAPSLLTDPFYYSYDYNRSENESNGTRRENEKGPSSQLSPDYYDSAVEEKFVRKFESAATASSTGWKLYREPDPLIVSDGRAFIPDFMFEKYGRKVYLEIVGFWTPEYLERKLKKLADIFVTNHNAASSETAVDLFIALNKDLACSNAVLSSLSFHLIPKDQLILYGNDAVPVRPILEYLKSIDRETMEQSINNPKLKAEIDRAKDVIPIEEIRIIDVTRSEKNKDNSSRSLPPEIVMKLALRDCGDRYIEVTGTYLISKAKMASLMPLLEGISKFTDACAVLAQNEIPESCQAEVVSKLGYDVVWQSMDSSSAVIAKRNKRKESNAA